MAETNVEPAWKMNTDDASPPPFNVNVPVNARPEADWYTPGTRVEPPRSPETVLKGVRDAASKYAAVRSAWAISAGAFATFVTPELCTPGGKPETEVPGARPMSPAMTDEPVLVIVLPAKTAYADAVARFTLGVAAFASGTAQNATDNDVNTKVSAKAARPRA